MTGPLKALSTSVKIKDVNAAPKPDAAKLNSYGAIICLKKMYPKGIVCTARVE